ncbi:MAG: hypothetical protein INH34_19220 [Phycisphaerales bacterium]|nr:hypothetical protein [Phycisphaerales bacterium]
MAPRNARIEDETTTLGRKALGVGLAIAAIAVVAWAMVGRPEAVAPAAVVAAAPPAFQVLESSWGAAPTATQPEIPVDPGFTPAVQRDDEARRVAEARERWQNLDIAVSTER